MPDRPERPYYVQWRIDGVRKSKAFPSKETQFEFAKSLAGDVKRGGVEAFRLNEAEAREYRALRAQIGPDVSLEVVLAVWERSKRIEKTSSLLIRDGVAAFLTAKKAEGMEENTSRHYRTVMNRFMLCFGERRAGILTREEIAEWAAGLKMADYSRHTHIKRIRSLFEWLRVQRHIVASPCDGIKPNKIVQEEVEILTVEQCAELFKQNAEHRELCGRLALEAFCGLRFSSAAQVVACDIGFADRGITLPAAKIKTRRRQFIDGLPANLWAWLEWSRPAEWSFTPRQYLKEKSDAFIRAKIPHPHNCLRHSFGTYHMAMNKDASKTAAILCHTSPKMLYQHYKGVATEAQGAAYFQILPVYNT